MSTSLEAFILLSTSFSISSYSGKEIEVNVTIDPSIIGGIVTRIGSTVIDGSIKTYLNQIRQSIIRG